jgi:Flp pilus assembly CpaE family ATPase
VKPQVCMLGLTEITADMVPDFQISERCENSSALLKHLGFANPEATILDLDREEVLNLIISMREQFPKVAIVGVTGQENAALVIEALRAGCAQIARRPIDPNDLTIALRRAVGQFTSSANQGQIIASFGTRGTGSTTVATYLGIELAAQSQQSTALFDLDLEFGGVARLFDVSPTYTVADLGEVGDADRTILDRASFSPVDNLRVFAPPQ